jgi:hypothetical protein
VWFSLNQATLVIIKDDDGIFSKTRQRHWTHLRALFAILTANSLALNLEKCVFAVTELDFLGHPISAAGIVRRRRRPFRDNVQVIFILTFINLHNADICDTLHGRII